MMVLTIDLDDLANQFRAAQEAGTLPDPEEGFAAVHVYADDLDRLQGGVDRLADAGYPDADHFRRFLWASIQTGLGIDSEAPDGRGVYTFIGWEDAIPGSTPGFLGRVPDLLGIERAPAPPGFADMPIDVMLTAMVMIQGARGRGLLGKLARRVVEGPD